MDLSAHDESPCLEGLIAGTVALMTALAAPGAASSGQCPQRLLLARKVVSNLLLLQHHPALSPELCQVMANAHRRWLAMTEDPDDPGHAGPGLALAGREALLH